MKHPSRWLLVWGLLVVLSATLWALPSFADTAGQGAAEELGGPLCTNPDCVVYDISTQPTCLHFTNRPPKNNSQWVGGLSTLIDNQILVEPLNGVNVTGWDVRAYRIRWFNGSWSEWYLTGVNDIDYKFNPSSNTMRRIWSYFHDHTHEYIACHHPSASTPPPTVTPWPTATPWGGGGGGCPVTTQAEDGSQFIPICE